MNAEVPQPAAGRRARVVVLMYHGLYADERERLDIDAADRPYAVSVDEFRHHLDTLAAAGLPLLEPQKLMSAVPDTGGVVLSFDDGHASNHRHAAPELAKRRARAIFFVTSDFIGQRRGFCSMAQLREMATSGHTIGAHGRTHRFIDTMDEREARAEFTESRAAIEQGIGTLVDQMSFPGGRYTPRQIAWGREAGYSLMHTSQLGSHPARSLAPGAVLRRVAVKGGMPVARLAALAGGDPGAMLPAQLMAAVKQTVRRAVGNKIYHGLYERLAG